MTDRDFAEEIVRRLNKLCRDPQTMRFVDTLFKIPLDARDLVSHPTIRDRDGRVGLLDVLNGLGGVIPSGPLKSFGYIKAFYIEDQDPEKPSHLYEFHVQQLYEGEVEHAAQV